MLTTYGRDRAGVDALALDPQDSSKVYVALGEYTNRCAGLLTTLLLTTYADCHSWDPNNGAIARSSDQGATWTFTNVRICEAGLHPASHILMSGDNVRELSKEENSSLLLHTCGCFIYRKVLTPKFEQLTFKIGGNMPGRGRKSLLAPVFPSPISHFPRNSHLRSRSSREPGTD